MEEFFVIAIASVLFFVALWTIAFVLLKKYQQKKGVRTFRIFLLSLLIIEAILFALIVVPIFGCTGWLCGVYELLIFLAITGVLLLLSPISMMIMAFQNKKKKSDEQFIDRIEGF